ncbi:MAG: hypothetical protein JWR00_1559 [Rubritepida sp.]|nr:hypothetical protein [Rubritepida sp.]
MVDNAPDGDVVLLGDAQDEGGEVDPNVVELREDGDDDTKLPDRAVVRDDGSIFLTLLRPVTLKFKMASGIREESFESFVFHPLTGADMRVIKSKPPESVTTTTISRSTRIQEGKINPVYDRMDARDTMDVERVLMHFLNSGRPTGR